MAKKNKQSTSEFPQFPPVIAVLGHVDHGKTTLLDAIRKTNIAGGEHGGITQKIGASSIEIVHESKKRQITFIDTPGHEAFSAMRSRGAQAADISLLIISSVDGIMPQTKESLKLILDAKIPFIVVLTKSDSPQKNPEKVKGQLLKEGVMLEGTGGDVPIIEVSAKVNQGIKELLDLILLVRDVQSSHVKESAELVSKEGQFKAIVIESKLDQKSGPKATIVVKNGTISLRDELVCEETQARTRSLINDKGEQLTKVSIGDAVEISGFEAIPPVGGVVYKKSEANLIIAPKKELEVAPKAYLEKEENTLVLILCADTLGSLEAITGMLPEGILVITQKTGDVASSDVLLAKSTKAIILGFNVKIRPDAQSLARTERILIRNYTIIYELIDDIKDVIEGKKQALIDEIFGTAKILASFPFEKTKVAGIKVLDGRVAKGDRVKLIRNDVEIGYSHVNSLRQAKNIVSKVEKGQEAGVVLSPLLDFTIGDMLVFHR